MSISEFEPEIVVVVKAVQWKDEVGWVYKVQGQDSNGDWCGTEYGRKQKALTRA